MLFFIELVYLAAGLLIYFFIHNRILSHLRGGITKTLVQLALLVIVVGLAILLSILSFVFSYQGIWLAIGILLLAMVGEVRHVSVRQRLRGAPPVEVHSVDSSFPHDLPRSGKLLDRWVTTLDLQLACYELEVPTLTGPGFSVLHLSDLHVSDELPANYYRRTLEQVSQLKPDLVFLTGDFVSHLENLPLLSDLLSTLPNSQAGAEAASPRLFAIFGNHDYWTGPQEVRKVLQQAGIELLQGTWKEVEVSGKTILLGGDESPWGKKLSGCSDQESSDLVLILSHTPDNIFRLVRQCRPIAVFSGHLHGGQIRIPLPWAFGSLFQDGRNILRTGNIDDRTMAMIVPSIYGRRFDHGHFVFPQKTPPVTSGPVPQTHLFVTAGIGAGGPLVRILCPPDMFLVRFKGAP